MTKTGWKRAVSLPAALLGIVAFFMPWLQVSCGPVTFRFSGYECATGKAQQKMDSQAMEQFDRNMQKGLQAGLGRDESLESLPKAHAGVSSAGKSIDSDAVPVLWSIPVACGVLFVLALVGLPRIATVSVSLLASVYLAYVGVSWESQLSDPAVTGGILGHSWLAGYWLSWVALLAPTVMALVFHSPPEEVSVGLPSPNASAVPPSSVRQAGSVFGLTLGQQPRAAYAWAVPRASEAPTDPMDIPIRTGEPTLGLTRSATTPVSGPSNSMEQTQSSTSSDGDGMKKDNEHAVYTYEAPGLPLCPECGVRPVIFYCRRHSQALCLGCVVRHDRAGECTYVPGWRGKKSEAQ